MQFNWKIWKMKEAKERREWKRLCMHAIATTIWKRLCCVWLLLHVIRFPGLFFCFRFFFCFRVILIRVRVCVWLCYVRFLHLLLVRFLLLDGVYSFDFSISVVVLVLCIVLCSVSDSFIPGCVGRDDLRNGYKILLINYKISSSK
jgi:hypothetical protein